MSVLGYKYGFNTAYLQREVVLDVAVVGAADLETGRLVTLTAAASGNPAYISAKTTAPAVGDYIIAQSDMTMGYGHVPVELRDYRYSDKVAVTAASIGSTAGVKKVALYRVTNPQDLVLIKTYASD